MYPQLATATLWKCRLTHMCNRTPDATSLNDHFHDRSLADNLPETYYVIFSVCFVLLIYLFRLSDHDKTEKNPQKH